MIGRVVSTKVNNTVTVLVERVAKHTLYKKTFVRTKKYLVDDPIGVKMGDMVEIIKVRPISKNKHWKIIKVVGKNLEAIIEEKLKTEAEKIIAEVMPEEKVESRVESRESSEKEVKNKQSLRSKDLQKSKVKSSNKNSKATVRKEKTSPKTLATSH